LGRIRSSGADIFLRGNTLSRIEEIYGSIRESIETKERLFRSTSCIELLDTLVQASIETLENGGKIIFCGNGGSFADAQHLSAEFTSRFMFDRNPLSSIALGTNGSTISAIGNDYGYEKVFARELEAVGKPEDTLIAISTSGNSPNILEVISVARESGLSCFGFTGEDGGKMAKEISCLKIPSNETARIQEAHITCGHVICELVEGALFPAQQESNRRSK
jgi:D-sedoheptulose 7-phosphate isomerase